MILSAILLALQVAPAEQSVDAAAPSSPVSPRASASVDLSSTDADREARVMMAKYAACIADSSADKVAEVLTRDFRTTEYRNGLRNLSRANEGCARQVGLNGSLRMSGLRFAAALAEDMMRRDPAPLNVRLAKAASGTEAVTYAPSDAMAMCIARSAPDEVAGLLSSAPGTVDEQGALAKLEPIAAMCSRNETFEISPVGLRSIVATASYRLLAAQGG